MIENLIESDYELINKASDIIKNNFDYVKENHTVGAAVRCKNGNIYVGVNIYSLHGACAETIAIGTAITNGEREFECIVAVRGKNIGEILSPCGNCRQLLIDYAPECYVIVNSPDGLGKVKAKHLIPFAYNVPDM